MTATPNPQNSTLKDARLYDHSGVGTGGSTDGQCVTPDEHADSVGDIDRILEKWAHRQDVFAQKEVEEKSEEQAFLNDFEEMSGRVIKPAMEAIVAQLQKDGGDGLISDAESESRHRPRLILWMSLNGKIVGSPRQDHNPFLQLDVDSSHRRVDVWEGDMWENSGVSRATAPWELKEISIEAINRRVMGILGRATSHTTEF